jgi:Domain of Unknown Function (DUF1080)
MRQQRLVTASTLALALLLSPALIAQQPAPTTAPPKPTKKMAPAPMAAASPNQLTDDEKKAGWILLFDGKDLAGWRGYKKTGTGATGKESNGRWTVLNGAICLPPGSGQDTHGERDIITDATYKSFDLKWQWKISSGGNSGLKYFVTEKNDSAIGHEYQMIDDDRHPDAKIGPHRATAAFYDVLPPDPALKKVKPIGEWNDSRVVVNGNHVEHWLNGYKVLEYTLESPELKAQIAKSKFAPIDDFDKALDAHLLLQDHGNEVCFRSIKILPKK